MKVLIYGMGAIGSVFAARLSKIHKVIGICRGEHYRVVKNKGLKLIGETQGTYKIDVKESVEELEDTRFDLVIVTTKVYDLRKALRTISEFISFQHVLAIQNGLNMVEILKEEIQNADALVGVTYNAATLEKPGIVRHVSTGKTYIKSLVKVKFEEELASILTNVGLPTETPQDIFRIIWEKAIVNCVINPLTAILCEKNKVIADLWEELLPVIDSVVGEIIEASQIVGVTLPEKEYLLKKIKDISIFTGENTSSMLQDLKRGKRTEIEALNCYIANILERKGRSKTANGMLCYIIKALEKKSIQS
ncbi:MAG TPA: 2-dehydropantoate 2-reductase [Euryarchaeota archaeon]|nr:2-dehydropantoate 2-reductase [Euryarchaeota archaeon]